MPDGFTIHDRKKTAAVASPAIVRGPEFATRSAMRPPFANPAACVVHIKRDTVTRHPFFIAMR